LRSCDARDANRQKGRNNKSKNEITVKAIIHPKIFSYYKKIYIKYTLIIIWTFFFPSSFVRLSISLTRRTKIPHLKKESKNIILFLVWREKPRVSRGRNKKKWSFFVKTFSFLSDLLASPCDERKGEIDKIFVLSFFLSVSFVLKN